MRRTQLLIGMVSALAIAGWAAAQTSGTSARGAVATVGSLRVERDEFEPLAARAIAEHERTRGPANENVRRLIRRQLLEQLIRARLLMLESGRRNVAVSASEIDAEFRTHPFFQVNGRFDADRFAKVKAANSPEYQQSVAQIRAEIGGRKLDRQVRSEQAPDPRTLRENVERTQARARLESWVLRTSEFDGRYPEPRERDVIDYYRAHLKDFSRLERAEISAIEIGDPAASTGPEATRRRAQERADSLIAALRAGADFDAAGSAFGGHHRRVSVTPQSFPGFWQGTPEHVRAVFGATAGAVLEQPVPSREGWLVVRVDAVRPAGAAPLREVSREIRRILRERTRLSADEPALRRAFEERRSMLREPAYRVRWAVFDAERSAAGNPSAADLERYYRSHLADFSEFDPRAGAIRTKPLEEVRDDVARRWREERRVVAARAAAERLEDAWRRGRRDRAIEGQAVYVREAGPLRAGTAVDTGAVARLVSDSLAARNGAIGVGIAPFGAGAVVFHVHERIADWTPSFEEYRTTLLREREAEERLKEEEGARAMFERNPARFAQGDVIHFTEYIVPMMPPMEVPLTRREVEQYHMQHLDEYAAAEEIRVRHILIAPDGRGADADAAARREAEDLLAQIRGGADFQDLARRHSDDPPTREKGGDLGFFGRGTMLDAFERVAFALQPGEVSSLVKTEAGYHIIQLADRVPLVAEPLVHVYTNVASDAAMEKAERMARQRADSLLRVVRTAAQLRAAVKKLGIEVWPRQFRARELETMPPSARPFLTGVTQLQPGEVLRQPRFLRGHGVGIAVADSLVPERVPEWAHARDRVIDTYRHERVHDAMKAKLAELDSLERAGWSVDSLANLWGGFERSDDVPPGKGVPTLGGIAVIDSLVFGARGAKPALAEGVTSDWVWLDRGVARIRVAERRSVTGEQLSSRVERARRFELERNLQRYFEGLRGRFPVRIHDAELADVRIPPPPNPYAD